MLEFATESPGNDIMLKTRTLLVCLLLLSSFPVHAIRAEFSGKVVAVQLDGAGTLTVTLDRRFRHGSCERDAFRVPYGHAQIDRWLKMVLWAMKEDREITARSTNCVSGYPILDEGRPAWIAIKPFGSAEPAE